MTTDTSVPATPGYLALLRIPDAATFAVPGIIGRFSLATRSLTSALMVQEVTGSYGKAGIIGGIITLVAALASPRLSQIADRHGTRGLMIGTMAAHVVAAAGLIVATYAHAPLAVLMAFAVAIGCSSVSFGAISRACWTRVVPRGPVLDRAFAFEAIAEDLAFIVAPAAAIPLTLEIHPAAGLVISVVLTVIASIMLYRLPQRLVQGHSAIAGLEGSSIFRRAGHRVMLAALFCFGAVFGSIELMLVAFAREIHNESIATVLLVLIAVGSFTGGVTYGVVRWRASALTRAHLFGALFAVSVAPILIASNAPTMAMVVLISGCCISPTVISVMSFTERITSATEMTQTFAWLGSSISIGAAAGIFLGGRLIDWHGATGAQVLVVTSATLAFAVPLLFRGTLRAIPES
jgi:predicted MFS family arabinose efflux permease